MDQPLRVTVDTPSRRYPIVIGQNILGRLPEVLDEAGAPARRFVVSSPRVWKAQGTRLTASIIEPPILVPDGERSKTLQTVSRVYDALIERRADRASTLITFGGGVIGDLAGFAAATYLRGISLVHVPTTLLAQVDSAVGGKVGVNHPLGKNLIGAFHQPHAVVIDPVVLSSLPRREFRAGIYEVIKYGVTSSPELFERVRTGRKAILRQDPSILLEIIAESCRIKGSVVAADERESGLRRILNFGHTAGHAIEAVTEYRRFRHGEAVAYGMRVAAQIAATRGTLNPSAQRAIDEAILGFGPLPTVTDLSTGAMLHAMQRDKKVVAGRLHFVLPAAIGRYTIVDDVTSDEIADALAAIGFVRAA
jgi:3-dehydroquinate synthase